MMHRFVALVATSPDRARFQVLRARLRRGRGDWPVVLDRPAVIVFSKARTPSALGARRVGADQCLVGIDFPAGADGPLNRAARGAAHLASDRWGGFVAIEADGRDHAVRAYRDPSGRIECWRMPLDGAEVLFSHLDDVRDLRPPAARLNWDYLTYHLNSPFVRGAATGLEGVFELPPGEELLYRDSPPKGLPGWSPEAFVLAPFESPEIARAALRDAAEQAATAMAGLYDTIALDLSGGLDSSVLLGLLKRVARHPRVIGVNYVTPHAESDERAFARRAAAFHDAPLIERLMEAGERIDPNNSFAGRLLRPAPRMLASIYDDIAGAAYASLCAEAFFTGAAGDHLFSESLDVRATCDFVRDHGVGRNAIRTAHHLAQVSNRTIWGAFAAVIADRFGPSPGLRAYLQVHNDLLTEAARNTADFDRFAPPWLRNGLGRIPPAKLRQVYGLCELQRHYARYGRADVAEEGHPLFTQPVIEAALRTPSYWFAEGGLRRGLMRRTFADLLPDEIRTRRTKSANTSLWLTVMGRDLPRIRSLLLEGRLASRGLIDRTKVEAALTDLAVIGARRPQPGLRECLTTEMWIQQMEVDWVEASADRRERQGQPASAPTLHTAL